MNEYALLIDGSYVRSEKHLSKPDDIPHKKIIWLPVEYETPDYNTNTQTLSNNIVIRIELDKIVKTREIENISHEKMIEKIIEERESRLSLGFDYDFNDARGIHKIGTTEQDMKGWDEVTKAASSMISLGLTNQTIDIVTNTGPVTVTAIEWMNIILRATQVRQPIWAASFELQQMNPIPEDYDNNTWWK